ncbi:MAG: F0F1 ATP synthase subunit epsilon [Chitinivibrionia bacterium]|nr:F0F1 ATP synthase subunit epsilon [Chitinivibrionia bacterium]
MPTFNFKILTPNRMALDAAVTSIVVPGEAGYLGALANHAPLITTLAPGKLKVTFEGRNESWYLIGGGILKILHNEAVLLTESIEETTE